MSLASYAVVERDLELAADATSRPFDERCDARDDGGHRVGLDRIVQLDVARHRCAEVGDLALDDAAVIAVERRAPDVGDERRDLRPPTTSSPSTLSKYG